MDNKAIANILYETADLLALTGREPFRARAYERGARVLEGLSEGDRIITSSYDTYNTVDELTFSTPLESNGNRT